MVGHQLLAVLCHLTLDEHHPLELREQVGGELLLGLDAPLPGGEDVLVVPHHNQELLAVAGAQVRQDRGVPEAGGTRLVLLEGGGQVLLLHNLPLVALGGELGVGVLDDAAGAGDLLHLTVGAGPGDGLGGGVHVAVAWYSGTESSS